MKMQTSLAKKPLSHNTTYSMFPVLIGLFVNSVHNYFWSPYYGLEMMLGAQNSILLLN